MNRLSTDMDKKKLESFKKRLEERQQALRKAVSRTEEDGRIADQDTAQDIADRAASSYTKEFLFSQSNNDRQLLAMVETGISFTNLLSQDRYHHQPDLSNGWGSVDVDSFPINRSIQPCPIKYKIWPQKY